MALNYAYGFFSDVNAGRKITQLLLQRVTLHGNCHKKIDRRECNSVGLMGAVFLGFRLGVFACFMNVRSILCLCCLRVREWETLV